MPELPTKHVSRSVRDLNPHLYAKEDARTTAAAQNTIHRTDLVQSKSTDEAKLNKLEKAYLAQLRMLKVPCLHIQKITLKIADDCRLTADFTYVDANGQLMFVDVKGFQREDAFIKMKVAAAMFPEFRFTIVTRHKGEWESKHVKP